jgi:predicted PurR-regulated permease PerM
MRGRPAVTSARGPAETHSLEETGAGRPRASVLVVLAAVAAVVLWLASDVVLLAFAGILVALFLDGLASWVAAYGRVPARAALALVVCALAAVMGIAGWLIAPAIGDQLAELADRLPRVAAQIEQRLDESRWGRLLVRYLPSAEAVGQSISMQRVGGTLAATLGWTLGTLANVLLVLFIGIYLAADPDRYVRGALRILPPRRRDRAREVLAAIAETLRRWLLGKIAGMLIIGVLTGVGLAIIGVPLALSLGCLAGALNFVPYVGPLVSFVPAALLAFVEGPTTLGWVAALYIVIQGLESYAVTPLIQQRAVALPPAFLITMQVLAGMLLGLLGLLLATPATAAAVVAVRMLYVEPLERGGR